MSPLSGVLPKAKSHKRYELGSKASFITTSKDNWAVSAQSLDTPYDGHTLGSALKYLTQLTGITSQDAYCDMGYQGHGLKSDTKIHLFGKTPKRATKSLRKWVKWRAAVEPIIGHLKSDYRLNRNHLKDQAGDRANVVLAAAAYNMSKLMAWFYCAAFLRQKIEAFIDKFGINLSNERKLIT